MRWTEDDMKRYEEAKEYIDTALIPVFSIDLGKIGVEMVKEQKWLEEVCVYSERQLTGRMLLLPTLYVLGEQMGEQHEIPSVSSQGFAHVVFITANERLQKRLLECHADVYLLSRKENEEDLTEMVREGKKLAKSLMERWKK